VVRRPEPLVQAEGRKMKTPVPPEENPSAPNSAKHTRPGRLPDRLNTARADLLRRLLEGERVTGMDAVFRCSTTRLSAVIFDLENTYGWYVLRDDHVVGCKDGRTATIARYWLDSEAIERARAAGADHWCAEVKAARAELRRKAAEAEREAARRNELRRMRPKIIAEQRELFESWGARG
jgi:hypothetical protein